MSGAADWPLVIARHAVRRSATDARYVTPVRPQDASGLVATVYEQLDLDFGLLAPPVVLHSPAPVPLVACWALLRETLVVSGAADRRAKEVVATEVSAGNDCPYCVFVHTAALSGLSSGVQSAADPLTEPVSPEDLARIGRWARAGVIRDEAVSAAAPFPARTAPGLIGVAFTFHYLNRMVNVFLGESPMPRSAPAAMAGPVSTVLGRVIRAAADRGPQVGRARDLLPAAALPDDLAWAGSDPAIADVVARACAAIEAAAEQSVPVRVRELLRTRLAAWDGRPPGLSRSWLDAAVEPLPVLEQAAGRLALATALAAYQVTADDVGRFRVQEPSDQALIELTSWASLTAARQVTSWIPVEKPVPPPGR